jgi:putative proteasome-type protease
MTFCIGIKVKNGLVAFADTQITKGSERLKKGKLSCVEHGGCQLFIMSSGLRSLRDKTMLYLEEALAKEKFPYDRLYQVANCFGEQLRRVRNEDGQALGGSGLNFNLNAIIGGRLQGDSEPALFHIYPEGNWIEATADAPYFIIGRSFYGKPILDRLLRGDSSLKKAITLAYLAFDATHTSVTDVGFPADILVLDALTHTLQQHRFEAAALAQADQWWQERLSRAVDEFPMDWSAPVFPAPTNI